MLSRARTTALGVEVLRECRNDATAAFKRRDGHNVSGGFVAQIAATTASLDSSLLSSSHRRLPYSTKHCTHPQPSLGLSICEKKHPAHETCPRVQTVTRWRGPSVANGPRHAKHLAPLDTSSPTEAMPREKWRCAILKSAALPVSARAKNKTPLAMNESFAVNACDVVLCFQQAPNHIRHAHVHFQQTAHFQ